MKVVLLLACALATIGCARFADPVITNFDPKEMAAAIEQARDEVDQFVGIMTRGEGERFLVKVLVRDGEKGEHFWMGNLKFDGVSFEGELQNAPDIVTNVKLGQKWKVRKSEISDWMFYRDGKIHGNHTLRPLLKSMKPEEAEEYRRMLAKP